MKTDLVGSRHKVGSISDGRINNHLDTVLDPDWRTVAWLCPNCPNFLLAPGSALAAPENVRRQLKAVYVASLLSSQSGGIAATEENLEDAAAPGGPFASDEEKHQVVALLARELCSLQQRKPREPSRKSEAEALLRPPALSRVKSPGSSSAPSLLHAHRSGATSSCMGAKTPPTAARSPRRWPSAMR